MIRIMPSITAVVFAATLLAAPAAQAVTRTETCTTPNPPPSQTVVYMLGHATNSGCGPTNNTPTSSLNFLGVDWTFAQKWENMTGDIPPGTPGGVEGPGTPIEFSSFTFGASEGTWTVDGADLLTPGSQILMLLKQKTTYAGFILDLSYLDATTGLLSGTWKTDGAGKTGNISHASLFYNGTVIPLPAGAALILAAFGVAGIVSRTRRAA